MRRAGRWEVLLSAGLYVAVAGCGGDDVVALEMGGSAVAGDAAGAHADSGQSGTAENGGGGTGGSTATSDSSPDIGKEAAVAMPDVSSGDAFSEAADVGALDGNADTATDAASELSSDVSSETPAEAGAPDDAIADAVDDAAPLSKICALGCVTTDDCRADASTSKLLCDLGSHRCVACIDDLPCIAGVSQWVKTCTGDADCTVFGDYCVDVGGLGYCAYDSAKIGTLSCSGNASSYTIMKHGGSQMVSVCAKLTNTCDLRRGRCEGPCTITCGPDGGGCTNTCTVSRGGKICNPTTKRCECASDNDCATPTSHCNLVTLQCECASGNDCAPDAGTALVCK